jgi:hypothetical protein
LWAKGNEADVAVKLLLAGCARDNGKVISVFQAVLPHEGGEATKDLGIAELLFDGKQTDFAYAAAGGQMGIQVWDFLIEGKRTAAAGGNHANDPLPGNANKIGVFEVEFIHQAWSARGLMLRDFLHEGFIIQLMNLFELPVLGCHFKLQGLRAHRMRRGFNLIDTVRTINTGCKGMRDKLPFGGQPVKGIRQPESKPNPRDLAAIAGRRQSMVASVEYSTPCSYIGRREVGS